MKTSFEKQSLVWGGLLIIFGVAALIETFTDLTTWGWVIVLFAAGIYTIAVNWRDREHWINFLSTYILWAIAGLIALISLNVIRGEAVATYVLSSIGLPFIIGWFRDKKNWGLLIPAYTLIAVGVMVGFIGSGWLNNLLIPAYVMFAIAVPFFTVYILNTKNWWALIPGGIMGLIGISFLLASPAFRFVVPLAMVIFGLVILVRQFGKGRKNQ